jgi:glucose/arabinose dehydrogenase
LNLADVAHKMKQLTLLLQVVVTLFTAALSTPTQRQATIGTSSLRAPRLGPTNAMNVPALRLTAHRISLSGRRSFDLDLPEGFEISVAAQGLKRVRFMANSPDHRIFVTDMYSLADNRKGAVYILDQFDPADRRFKRVLPYLKGLRNPNSIAFYTDQTGTNWFYLALTDRLVRYKYESGENTPTGQPEVLATFPDYGLGYKYGGWHLTRTVVIGDNGKIYVSVGSSCNACEETEEVRASILEMDPDGKNRRYFARGLRNAVGLRWFNGQLFATNMGADDLGDNRPADTLYTIKDGANYGWPYCFQYGARVYVNQKYNALARKKNCRNVPSAYVAFAAHSSPLGLDHFDSSNTAELNGSWLVALHGSTKKSLNRGYRLVRISGAAPSPPDDFITGFLQGRKVNGRPADVLSFGTDAFLFTDDYAGVVYYVYKK